MSTPCNLTHLSRRTSQAAAGTSAVVGVACVRAHTPRCLHVLASRMTDPAPPASASNSGTSSGKGADESIDWTRRGVPAYLQSSVDFDVCDEESQALTMGMAGDLLWNAMRTEAQADADSEPLLSSFLYASILAHDSFELALAFVLANRLANSTMLPTQLFEIFYGVLSKYPDVRCAALSDIAACRERDPACTSYSQALLYYKGYHALQTQRIAHALWSRNQKVMALALQSRMSEVFAVDIHPAARIGKGVLLDHGTGVVIGETAIIGSNVSILQNVTLGGTGKEIGDRHPKVGDNVLIGACATILGNIPIGKGAQIAAGSLVLKPVPPHTLVAGSPAKEIGPVVGNPALSMRHWSRRLMPDGPAAAVASLNPQAAAAQPAAVQLAAVQPAVPQVPPPVAEAAAVVAAPPQPPAADAGALEVLVTHVTVSLEETTLDLNRFAAAAGVEASLAAPPKPSPMPAAAAGTDVDTAAAPAPAAAPVQQESGQPAEGGPAAAARKKEVRKKPLPEYEI